MFMEQKFSEINLAAHDLSLSYDYQISSIISPIYTQNENT